MDYEVPLILCLVVLLPLLPYILIIIEAIVLAIIIEIKKWNQSKPKT